jgi:hypothetical protein
MRPRRKAKGRALLWQTSRVIFRRSGALFWANQGSDQWWFVMGKLNQRRGTDP